MADSPFRRCDRRRQIYLVLSSSPWHFPHCVFKGLQLNHFLPRNINSCALPCFSGADTGEENKAREDQRVNRCHCWACRAQARCAIVKIHSTSVLLMTFDLLPFTQRAEVFRTNGLMKSFKARSSRNTRQEAFSFFFFLEQFFCWSITAAYAVHFAGTLFWRLMEKNCYLEFIADACVIIFCPKSLLVLVIMFSVLQLCDIPFHRLRQPTMFFLSTINCYTTHRGRLYILYWKKLFLLPHWSVTYPL